MAVWADKFRNRNMTTLGPIFTIRCVIAIVMSALIGLGCNKQGGNNSESTGQLPSQITFNTHIAPLVWNKCAGCHRPGQAAPFPLLTYAQVSKRAKMIVDVTGSGYMWHDKSTPRTVRV
jgi:hypothetical protein